MLYSVIIPTCNRNDLLAQCLDCLVPEKQEVKSNDYEVIVTDDGASNNARLFIDANYPWVKWIAGPQKGPASNRNNGAKYAKGDWLIFLDDDCLPDKDILNTYGNYINGNPNFKIFEGRITALGERKSPLDYAPINIDGGHLWSCNFAISKIFFQSINGFDENFKYPHMEDVDLKDRIEKEGEAIFFASEASVAHPWRKLANGKKLGMYQEMYIYYNAKNNKKVKLAGLLLKIARVHLALLRKSIFSPDIFAAIKIMFQHLLTVIIHYKKWKRVYVAKS